MLRRFSRRVGRQLGRTRRRLRHARDDRQTRQDRALARRLRDVFEQDLEGADVHGLHLYVKGGVVTVYGTVRHELDRDLLMAFIRQRPGVERAVAHLQMHGDERAS